MLSRCLFEQGLRSGSNADAEYAPLIKGLASAVAVLWYNLREELLVLGAGWRPVSVDLSIRRGEVDMELSSPGERGQDVAVDSKKSLQGARSSQSGKEGGRARGVGGFTVEGLDFS